MPEKFKNATLFLRLGPPSTLKKNPSRKRSFSKTLFELEEFDNAGYGRKTDCKQSFAKSMTLGLS